MKMQLRNLFKPLANGVAILLGIIGIVSAAPNVDEYMINQSGTPILSNWNLQSDSLQNLISKLNGPLDRAEQLKPDRGLQVGHDEMTSVTNGDLSAGIRFATTTARPAYDQIPRPILFNSHSDTLINPISFEYSTVGENHM